MAPRIQSNPEILRQVAALLGRRRNSAEPLATLDEVTDLLYRARRYYWIGIYLNAGRQTVRQTFRGPVAPCDRFQFGRGNVGTTAERGAVKVIADVAKDPTYSMCFVETRSEMVVPIKTAARTLGVIDVESDRAAAFGYADQVLLKQVAARIARYLTTEGRSLVRKVAEASEGAHSANPASEAQAEKLQPESEGAATASARRRAAGK